MIYTKDNDFDAFVQRINTGKIAECDEKMWWYWLEVLPPRWMNEFKDVQGTRRSTDFGTAEGGDIPIAFWSEGGRHFAQLVRKP